MKINEIIRERRKEQKLTQEQMAEYLGVSTPAVNKWEKGSSYPDITILPALARLLKVDLNTLLSFNEDLSDKEIGSFSSELAVMIQNKGFENGFEAGMAKIQEYPTCDRLIYTIALTLEGALFMFGGSETSEHRNQIEKLYERVACSEEEEIRNQANAMLISRYMEREEYEKAQALINTLPKAPVDRVQRQAQLYVKQGKLPEAAELLESKLMDTATKMQLLLMSMMEIALKEDKQDIAEHMAEISAETARLYDLCDYNTYTAHLQLAGSQKDADKCIKFLKAILSSLKSKWDVNSSMLYQHIKHKEGEEAFAGHMINGIIAAIQNDEHYDFLQANPKFLEIIKQYTE